MMTTGVAPGVRELNTPLKGGAKMFLFGVLLPLSFFQLLNPNNSCDVTFVLIAMQ